MNKYESLIYAGVGVSGAAVGFGVGYAVSKKRHEKIADAEIESVKETYSKAKENLLKPDLEAVVAEEKPKFGVQSGSVTLVGASVDAVDLGYISTEDELGVEPEPEAVSAKTSNVFTKYGDAKDRVEAVETTVDEVEVSLELSKESDTEPYLISIDDFHDGAGDNYSKQSVTYYVQDRVLIDEREEIIPNRDETVGAWAFENFGNLSLDPEVVYVRNKKLMIDFEVTRDGSSYQEQILGLKS